MPYRTNDGKQYKVIDGKLTVGSSYTRIFKGKLYTMNIVKDGNTVAFEVNGKYYNSPSAAARPIFKNQINGWRFWKMDKKK